MQQVNPLEQLLIDDGIEVIKIFLSISKEEQAERLEERKTDPLKNWKLGSLDQQAQEKWDVYSSYIDKLFAKTSTTTNPWFEVRTDDKKEARLAVMKLLLCQINGFDCKSLVADDECLIKHTGDGNV